MKRLPCTAVAFLWVGYVAVIAHMLYSELGINLIDDGFTLAYARRILDGQVPHRDFIIIRPALSPLLHVPELFFGGDFTYWLSRFVFFLQFACIAWFGTALVNTSTGRPFSLFQQSAFALVSFMVGCHSFPVMAWHTIDGLFLCVLGLCLRARASPGSGFAGYFLIGAAYLCKQSYVFVAPVALLLYGDWRKWKCVLASALPGLLYAAVLLLCGGFRDCVDQLLAQTGLLDVGLERYDDLRFFAGLAVGVVAASLLYSESAAGWPRRTAVRRAAGYLLLAVFFGLAIKMLYHGRIYALSFSAFGMVFGAIVYWILEGGITRLGELQIGTAAALLAWSASLSLGYNSPSLGSGLLITFLFALVYRQSVWNGLPWRPLVALAAALAAMPAFHHTRTHDIYREQSASQLTCSLAGVLPGARLIRTNPNTYAFLEDLNVAIGAATSNGMRYAILPEVAAHWPKAGQSNPLPIDWAKTTELAKASLTNRVVQSLEQQRDRQVVIVQKVTANNLQEGFYPLEDRRRRFAVVGYVREKFEKIGETRFFDLYR